MVGKLMTDKNEQNVSVEFDKNTKKKYKKGVQKRTLLKFATLLTWVSVFNLQDE